MPTSTCRTASAVSQEDIDTGGPERFEEADLPDRHETFGHERSPGIDNDPHITIFNGRLEGAAGYFSATSTSTRKCVHPLSNEREMVYIDLSLDVGQRRLHLHLAHELQHLVHFNGNRNEDLWVNEGLSEVAAGLARGPGDSFDE